MKEKFLYTYIIIVILAVFTTAFFQQQISKEVYESQMRTNLKNEVNNVLYLTHANHNKITKDIFNKFINGKDEKVGIIKNDWELVFNKGFIPNDMFLTDDGVIIALNGEKNFSTDYDETKDLAYLSYNVPFSYKSKNDSVLKATVPLNGERLLNRKFGGYIIFELLLGIVGAIVLVYIYISKVSKPIEQILRVSRQIAAGNFNVQMKIDSNSDFAILAASFNFMIDKLNQLVSQLKNSSMEVEAILNSMITGVIGIDSNQRILYLNPTVKKWFNLDQDNYKRKNIMDIFRNSQLDKAIFESLSEGIKQNENVIIESGNKFYKIYINVVNYEYKSEGAVLVIQDITEERNYNMMRTQFVANVSHELKTPLTSILGFIETLKTVEITDGEVRDKFLNIIETEAKRLQNLINDLLDISYLESNRAATELSRQNMHDIITEVLMILSKNSISKSISLEMKCSENVFIMSNKDKLKQMLINLVDNAIKYTPPRGKVTVRVNENNDYVVITVEDTGIGIPKEHISRLFERFYRVDKSRSRSLGGTGLGLAIVKHIVLSYNGKIEVESEINVGSKFIVSLPKNI